MKTPDLRTYIEINLDAIEQNYRQALALLEPGTRLLCVLKSNAYGHGLVPIARFLQSLGADGFAVSCAREALCLRKAGITGDILCMGLCEAQYLDAMIRERVWLTVADVKSAQAADAAAQRVGEKARVHIKLDTGMHRLGFTPDEAGAAQIERAAALPGLSLEGLYSHLQLITRELDEAQHVRLAWMLKRLAVSGVTFPRVHICDSIGMVRYPQWQHDIVRAGAFLFGVRPSRSEHMPFECRSALRFVTTIAQIHTVPAGEYIGYDEDHRTQRETRVATLCAGYGDGYPRGMGNVASVSIRGRLCPVLGVVCMDQMMVDVTDCPDAKAGDSAELMGGAISVAQVAAWLHTNRNECLTILSARPPRVYIRNGEIAQIDDQLLGGLANE